MNNKSSNKVQIALRIKTLRNESAISQEFVAEKLNISLSAYKKKEQGINNFSIEELILLKRMFSVTVDYILLGNEYEETAVWEEICCTSEADKLTLLFKLFKYFSQTEDVKKLIKIMSEEEIKKEN